MENKDVDTVISQAETLAKALAETVSELVILLKTYNEEADDNE